MHQKHVGIFGMIALVKHSPFPLCNMVATAVTATATATLGPLTRLAGVFDARDIKAIFVIATAVDTVVALAVVAALAVPFKCIFVLLILVTLAVLVVPAITSLQTLPRAARPRSACLSSTRPRCCRRGGPAE